MIRTCILLSLAVMSQSAIAQTIDSAVAGFVNPSVYWYVVAGYPDGSGQSLANCSVNGQPGNATIKVQVRYQGAGVAGIAKERVRIYLQPWNGDPHQERSCDSYRHPDADSDAQGWMYITLPNLKLYGQAPTGGGYEFYLTYDRLGTGNHERFFYGDKIYFRSPDYDSDGDIDLSDSGFFTSFLNNGVYDAIADFNGDGVENITDIGFFTGGMGKSCN